MADAPDAPDPPKRPSLETESGPAEEGSAEARPDDASVVATDAGPPTSAGTGNGERARASGTEPTGTASAGSGGGAIALEKPNAAPTSAALETPSAGPTTVAGAEAAKADAALEKPGNESARAQSANAEPVSAEDVSEAKRVPQPVSERGVGVSEEPASPESRENQAFPGPSEHGSAAAAVPEPATAESTDLVQLGIERPPRHVAAFHWIRDYFLGENPQFLAAVVPFCFLSMLLFTRHPFKTNFIFDEQEALLANPYVRSVTEKHPKFHWLDAFRRDFWGLGPERSIGSYRPLPNLIWRFLWWCGAREHNPFLHHWVNVLFHGANGAILTMIVWRMTKRKGLSWLAGTFFVAAAVLTEAVSGVVGISDVFGTFGCLIALYALTCRMPFMGFFVFLGTMIGLYSKESAMICVVMVPLFALASASTLFPKTPRRIPRTLIAFVAAAAAFVLYVESRRRLFPAPIPPDFTKGLQKPIGDRVFAAIMRWYAQPVLPKDPLNNPLAITDVPHRIAGALRVYFRGLGQVVFPKTLSGDYSAPQEPIPETLIFPESVLGALCLVLPVPIAAIVGLRSFLDGRKARAKELVSAAPALVYDTSDAPVLGVTARETDAEKTEKPRETTSDSTGALFSTQRASPSESAPSPDGPAAILAGHVPERPGAAFSDAPRDVPEKTEKLPDVRPLVAVSLVWVVACYFPVSNIPILLPTVRAERFWYFPVVGTSILIATFFMWLIERAEASKGARDTSRRIGPRGMVVSAIVAFTLFQCIAARFHANDYTNDLTFWDATRKAVPNSAKAHLNYSVMKGARGDLESRRAANVRALELAPEWPMASIYLGDTLCRMHRAEEAWPHYKKGFDLAFNDVNLLSLGIQCMWDEKFVGPLPKPGDGEPAPPEPPHRVDLRALAAKHPGSWLEWLTNDLIANGETHNGVDPKYRPRGYNEGPKE